MVKGDAKQSSKNVLTPMSQTLGMGRVKWFGGTQKESKKKLPYGFITDGGEQDLFAHVSKLDCEADDLLEGGHVVFVEHQTAKGREAHSVRILESESDLDAFEALLLTDKIPLEFRIRVLLQYSDPVGAGIIKLLVSTILEVADKKLDILNGMDIPVSDRDKSRLGLEWPVSWLDYELDGDVFNVMPHSFKENACRKHYSEFLDKHRTLSNLKIVSIEASEIYRDLNPSDFQLAERWCNRDGEYELAKMISARGAELAAKHFYDKAGTTVEDTALQQVTDGNDWLTHDLLLNNQIPIDVKNVRQSINASVLTELTVPRFKLDRSSTEVRICGVLSPYGKLKDIKMGSVKGEILFLGETTRSQIDALISRFNKPGHFQLEGQFREKLPVWLFNMPKSKGESEERTTNHRDQANCPEGRHWPYLPSSSLPCCIAAGLDLPKQIEEELPKWEQLFIKLIRNSGPLSLGTVYLTILSHFTHALKNMVRAEQGGFDPSRYWELLYLKQPSTPQRHSRRSAFGTQSFEASGPLGIIDPLGVVASLIEALELLWQRRSNLNIGGVQTLRVTPEGLVTGKFSNGKTKTILAYCGGFIEKKGRCGFSPLILGEHGSCLSCGKLKCPECNYCSNHCKEKTEMVDSCRIPAARKNK